MLTEAFPVDQHGKGKCNVGLPEAAHTLPN